MASDDQENLLDQIELILWSLRDTMQHLPPSMAPRPYISHRLLCFLKSKQALSFLQDIRSIKKLNPGDPLHIPMTPNESSCLDESLENSNEQMDDIFWSKTTALLPGRDPDDCLRVSRKKIKRDFENKSGPIVLGLSGEDRCLPVPATWSSLLHDMRSGVPDQASNVVARTFKVIKSLQGGSGSVEDTVIKATPYGIQCASAYAADSVVDYNRQGNVLLFNLLHDTTESLHGHCIPASKALFRTEYTPLEFRHPAWSDLHNVSNLDYLFHPTSSLLYTSVTCVRFTKNGRHLISAGSDGKCLLWDTRNGAVERVFYGSADSSRRGHIYDICGPQQSITPRAEVAREQRLPLKANSALASIITMTAISDAYEFLFASAADNGSVWIYDYRGRDEQGVELIPEDEIYPDTVGRIKHRLGGRQIQSASKRLATDVKFGTGVSKSTLIASHSSCQQKNNGAGTITWYDLVRCKEKAVFRLKSAEEKDAMISCIQTSSSGRYLLAGTDCIGSTLRVFDNTTQKIVHEFETELNDCNVVTFSPCETFIAAGDGDDSVSQLYDHVTIYDRRFAKAPLIMKKLTRPARTFGDAHRVEFLGVRSMLWSKCSVTDASPFLITGGSDGYLHFWRPDLAEEDALVHSVPVSPGVSICSVSSLEGSSSNDTANEGNLLWSIYGDEDYDFMSEPALPDQQCRSDDSLLCCGTMTGDVHILAPSFYDSFANK